MGSEVGPESIFELGSTSDYPRHPRILIHQLTEEQERQRHDCKSGNFYQGLDETKSEIRLLLIPLTEDKSVELFLFTVPLDEAPPYSALSYMWGDGNDTIELMVNGVKMKVTRSLAKAIADFRNIAVEQYPMAKSDQAEKVGERKATSLNISQGICLWADALCINQDGNLEKNHQIPLMRRIYSQALQVMAYIGDEMDTKSIEMVFTNLELIHNHRRKTTSLQWLREPGCSHLLAFDTLTDKTNFWGLLVQFLTQNYFYRLWVQQELGLAQVVFLYSQGLTLHREPVKQFCSWIDELSGELTGKLPGPCPHYIPLKLWKLLIGANMPTNIFNFQFGFKKQFETQYASNKAENQAFYNLVIDSHFLPATVPHDRIFALSALPGGRMIPIDYNKSVAEVFREFVVEYSIKSNLDLHFLHFCGSGTNQTKLNLPSWVPDIWRHRDFPEWPPVYRSDHGLVVQHPVVLSNYGIRVEGVNCDQVSSVEPSLKPRSAELFKFCFEYGWEENEDSARYPTNIGKREVLLRTWHLDVSTNSGKRLDLNNPEDYNLVLCTTNSLLPATRETNVDRSSVKVMRETYLQANPLLRQSPQAEFDEEDIFSEENLAKLQVACMELFDYRFFHTKKGLLGISKGGAQPGDQVCILRGCKVPVLLRKAKEESWYEVADTCFILGYMDGEVAEQYSAGLLRKQVFEIH
jgi:hypothetical protein